MSGRQLAKRRFAAIPPRARSDKRLTAFDWRVLVAIACHDMMGKGQGCWASSTTLGEEIGERPDSVRRAITRLIDFGYLRRDAMEGRTQRTLRIVHDDDDPTCGTGSHTSAPRPVANDAPPVARGATQIDSPYGEREEIAQSAPACAPGSLREPTPRAEKRNSAEAASGVNPEASSVDYVSRLKATYPSKIINDGEFFRYATAWVRDRTNQPHAGQESDLDLDEAERILDRLRALEDAGDPHTGQGLAAAALRLHGDLLWLMEQGDDPAELFETEDAQPALIGVPVRPVMPEEIAEPVLAFVAERWPDSAFTLSAAVRQGDISKRLMSATLDHLCERGDLERRRRCYRLRSES